MRRGEFREDLFHRLNGLSVRLPPLRERSDLMALVRRILDQLDQLAPNPPEYAAKWRQACRDQAANKRAKAKAREEALREMADRALAMGADAVIGVQISYAALGASDSMLMVGAVGTAVKLG